MADTNVTILVVAVLICLIMLLSCYLDINITFKESFGTDDRPFEPDNTLLNRNPWDDIDYVRPVFLTPA